jgi:hypothetical protein
MIGKKVTRAAEGQPFTGIAFDNLIIIAVWTQWIEKHT